MKQCQACEDRALRATYILFPSGRTATGVTSGNDAAKSKPSGPASLLTLLPLPSNLMRHCMSKLPRSDIVWRRVDGQKSLHVFRERREEQLYEQVREIFIESTDNKRSTRKRRSMSRARPSKHGSMSHHWESNSRSKTLGSPRGARLT
jgi:hypothetical protein